MDITEILSTINPSVWETLPLVVLEVLSTESTFSQAYDHCLWQLHYCPTGINEGTFYYMEYATQHTCITVKCHKVTHFPVFKP